MLTKLPLFRALCLCMLIVGSPLFAGGGSESPNPDPSDMNPRQQIRFSVSNYAQTRTITVRILGLPHSLASFTGWWNVTGSALWYHDYGSWHLEGVLEPYSWVARSRDITNVGATSVSLYGPMSTSNEGRTIHNALTASWSVKGIRVYNQRLDAAVSGSKTGAAVAGGHP